MAVEARRLPFPSPQSLSNRDLMNTVDLNGGFCSNQTMYGVVPLLPVADTPRLHMYGHVDTVAGADSFTPPIIESAGLPSSFSYYNGSVDNNNNQRNINCDFSRSPSRKRSRDYLMNYPFLHRNLRSCAPLSSFDQDISLQIHEQQLETDRLISLYMERVKIEMEERSNRQVRTIMETIEQGVMKKLSAKDEERERLRKLNNALEERVKTLTIENQIWRNKALSSEATVNALRTNLDQALNQRVPSGGLNAEDDAQSSCGDHGDRRNIAEGVQDKGSSGYRMCRNCGEEESCVLLLPCRHLCVCGVCGSALHTCPVCRSPPNASVHVNLSSSS